ncbi:hypothetical protein [Ferruginibacter sp.]|uniref:hypothetical protein n=1 Tax=Ferruginibacter sp. TaxID=1940288 RepID=UPI00265B1517|nr:hypothetical protein [Ferruginibacter sp.]
MSIQRMFLGTKVNTLHDVQLSWTHTISPSPLGADYKIKLVYHLTEAPKMYVVEPKPLALATGKMRLEHCYDQKLQRLCLYYPMEYEWRDTMLLTQTIIPWTYDWLYHYEIWLVTGEWTGGGVHGSNNTKKNYD